MFPESKKHSLPNVFCYLKVRVDILIDPWTYQFDFNEVVSVAAVYACYDGAVLRADETEGEVVLLSILPVLSGMCIGYQPTAVAKRVRVAVWNQAETI